MSSLKLTDDELAALEYVIKSSRAFASEDRQADLESVLRKIELLSAEPVPSHVAPKERKEAVKNDLVEVGATWEGTDPKRGVTARICLKSRDRDGRESWWWDASFSDGTVRPGWWGWHQNYAGCRRAVPVPSKVRFRRVLNP